jgi:8-oxo-dGTP pyrophosphatase MutT (NUDIX family)
MACQAARNNAKAGIMRARKGDPRRARTSVPYLLWMRWNVHRETVLYDSEWVRLTLVDVEIPDGPRFDHHVVRMPQDAAGVVVHDPSRGVLLLWRHRFITDSWGWEIPAGRIEPGETVAEAGARETLEETGWSPGPLRPLLSFHPVNGLSDLTFNIMVADGATYVGEPEDRGESERVEWVSRERLREILDKQHMPDGLSLTAITYALVTGALNQQTHRD